MGAHIAQPRPCLLIRRPQNRRNTPTIRNPQTLADGRYRKPLSGRSRPHPPHDRRRPQSRHSSSAPPIPSIHQKRNCPDRKGLRPGRRRNEMPPRGFFVAELKSLYTNLVTCGFSNMKTPYEPREFVRRKATDQLSSQLPVDCSDGLLCRTSAWIAYLSSST